ncbi:hypothetical protein N7474_010972 [Penicillium riverlandense]|uniref:uncharacterized protein n=1 Tax=Penicillium riverlandense TaxID=1903569 RepID=UPI0025466D52|nr:uncharacterized protein N7474_010972 [Penicillium riverlandense]KAJ5805085.1 hypothetical protein N7474_010972 [Penicillium riverlandense]
MEIDHNRTPISPPPVDEKIPLDNDDEELTRMGYAAEIPRKFTVFSLFAIGYEICVSPIALIVSLGVSMGSGGQATLIWGQFLIYFMAFCVAVSLAELASAYPNAGGQYYWAAMLAPKSIRRGTSFVVGYLSWASAVFGCASSLIASAEMAVALYQLKHPGAPAPTWAVFVTYQAFNIVMFFFNCWETIVTRSSRMWLTISILSPLVIVIAVLARTETKQSAEFVFTGFTNVTGWSNGIAFVTGLLGVNWGFSALDAVTHMSEEIPDPRRNVPKALMATIFVGAVLAWPTAIVMMFCVQDIEKVLKTDTGLPSLELFLQVFQGQKTGPIALQTLLLVASLGAVFGIQTWQTRLAWSIARDGGFPLSKYIKKIAPAPYEVPFWAHLWSSLFVALLGCLYLGSSIAFNSFVGGGILMQYVAYSICIVLLLHRGRSRIPHGPFWLGKLGLFCNIVTLVWTAFTLVFYSFPPYFPTTPPTMNYVSVVVVGFALVFSVYYWAFGRKSFTGPPDVE